MKEILMTGDVIPFVIIFPWGNKQDHSVKWLTATVPACEKTELCTIVS